MDTLDNQDAIRFSQLLESFQLSNNAQLPTSPTGHTLDLIIGDSSPNLIRDIEIEECTISPVYKLITFKLGLPKARD